VVHDDDLRVEHLGALRRVVLRVTRDEAALEVLDRDVLHVEANVVSWEGLGERLVVHLHGLDLSGKLGGGEGNDLAGLDDSGLNTTNRDCSNTCKYTNLR